jgi:hypothetical protein
MDERDRFFSDEISQITQTEFGIFAAISAIGNNWKFEIAHSTKYFQVFWNKSYANVRKIFAAMSAIGYNWKFEIVVQNTFKSFGIIFIIS